MTKNSGLLPAQRPNLFPAFLFLVLLTVPFIAGCGGRGESRTDAEGRKTAEKNIVLPEDPNPEDVVLTVEGLIHGPTPARFDLATIKKFKPVSFTNFDPWDKKDRKYTGVDIMDILEFLGLDDSARFIDIKAANGYSVSVDIHDMRSDCHIFSYAMDGREYAAYAGKENKGPLAVAIDFTAHPDLSVDVYKHQLVWFVQTVTVK